MTTTRFILGVTILATGIFLRSSNANPAPTTAPDQPGHGPSTRPALLQVTKTARWTKDVFYRKKDQWINLTKFPRAQSVLDAAVSPDGKWAYVWHGDRPPRILSIYDLTTLQRITSFAPGTGGDLAWTAGNGIFHSFGAGSGCCLYNVYDIHGKTILDGGGEGMKLKLSPDGRYLAAYPDFPSSSDPIEIRDMITMRVVYQVKGGHDGIWKLEGLAWRISGQVEIDYVDYLAESRSFKVDLARHAP
jgi:hypothetical protein